MKYALMFNVKDELSPEKAVTWVYLVDGEWGDTLYPTVMGIPVDVMSFDKVTDIYQWLEDNSDWGGHPWYYKVSESTPIRVVSIVPIMVQDGWKEV
jgi:hypothetical protein